MAFRRAPLTGGEEFRGTCRDCSTPFVSTPTTRADGPQPKSKDPLMPQFVLLLRSDVTVDYSTL
ncbi:MAG: hypothetical protein ABL997_09645, partial [Planctomycetota bacterium]